jgi:hypothetical protein
MRRAGKGGDGIIGIEFESVSEGDKGKMRGWNGYGKCAKVKAWKTVL